MPTAPQQSGRSALMKNVAPCATIVLVPRAVGGLRSRICRRPGNYECFRLPRLPHSLAISLPSLSAASSRADVQTAGHHYQWVLRSFVCPRAARACLVRMQSSSRTSLSSGPRPMSWRWRTGTTRTADLRANASKMHFESASGTPRLRRKNDDPGRRGPRPKEPPPTVSLHSIASARGAAPLRQMRLPRRSLLHTHTRTHTPNISFGRRVRVRQ